MRTIKTFLSLSVFLMMSSLTASAQPGRPQFPGGRPEGMPQMQERPSAKERATQRTDEMDKAIDLDAKQYKKIYKIFLKEENAKDEAIQAMMPPFPGGPGMGGGFPGGGFPGGGFPGGGFPGGPGAGGPPAGMPSPGDFGQMQKPTVGGKEIDSDEYIDAREAKFRKILTSEQLSKWHRESQSMYRFL